jgi:hypothetical protein
MTEEQRLENQAHYLGTCKSRGWLNENNQHLWPDDPQERAEMARELFGFALTNSLDTTFVEFRNRLNSSDTLKSLTNEQRTAVLREYDEILDFAMYQFSITLDRFDHGILAIQHGKPNDEEELIDPVAIHPTGIFEMFQDAVRWKEEYGRGEAIGRKNA